MKPGKERNKLWALFRENDPDNKTWHRRQGELVGVFSNVEKALYAVFEEMQHDKFNNVQIMDEMQKVRNGNSDKYRIQPYNLNETKEWY